MKDFSGGEKKKNEIFQMALLEPRLAILDETDSGLDIDALRIVANGVNNLRSPENATIVITHYQRLLDYIVPDLVHVLYKGRIVKSGDKSLAKELEEHGYDWIKQEVDADAWINTWSSFKKTGSRSGRTIRPLWKELRETALAVFQAIRFPSAKRGTV